MKRTSNKITTFVLLRATALFMAVVMAVSILPVTFARAADENTAADDMEIIKERLIEYFLKYDTIDDDAKVDTCYVSQAEDYMNNLQADGSWTDVEYLSTESAAYGKNWGSYLALDRMQAMAIAYRHKDHGDTKDQLLKAVNQALIYWGSIRVHPSNPNYAGPYSKNWWENTIGVQLRFARIALFLEGELSEEAWNILIDKLYVTENAPTGDKHGQNALWLAQNQLYAELLQGNEEKLKKVINDRISICLNVADGANFAEGVQVDNSFMFHGRLFYGNGYGMAMFRDMSFWIYMLRGTQFAIDESVTDMMGDYMLDGIRWTIRQDLLEVYHGYRRNKDYAGYANYAYEYVEPVERMIASDPNPERVAEYEKLLANLKGESKDNGLDGNYYMWRAAYASHMRKNYGVNVKMDSNFITGGEWRGSWPEGENYGNSIYWATAAATTVMVEGDEYIKVYPTFDWKHVPGTTAPTAVPTNTNNYQPGSASKRTAAVSDGTYGATAYDLNKWDTKGKKSVFFFDDEYVALGAQIQSNHSVEVHTTLNQAKAGTVTVGDTPGGSTVASGTDAAMYQTTWLHNDQIGYVFPEETNVFVSNKQQKGVPSLWSDEKQTEAADTFMAYLNHGTKPTDGSYAYIVYPGRTAAETEAYAAANEIEILSNTPDIQAVRHNGLKLTQISFYEPGELKVGNEETISVDFPCVVMVDESEERAKISVAVTDNLPGQFVNVKITRGDMQSTTCFITKALPYAGQTQTMEEGKSSTIAASSYVEPNDPSCIRDNNTATYWQSENNGDQWVSYMADAQGASKLISQLTIDWGSEYAKKYKIQLSHDGLYWHDAVEVEDGAGGIKTYEINDVAVYVRIYCTESSGSGFIINEVTEDGLTNLALKKTATASSFYDNGLLVEYATDGSLGTRWGSNRNKSGEWIFIDLGDYYNLDTVNLFWEGAYCSKYTIDVSNDSVNWKTVETITNGEKTLYGDNVVKHKLKLGETDITARYVRMSEVEAATKYGASLREFEIYGTPGEGPEPVEEETLAENFEDFSKVYDRSNNWTVGEVPADNPEGRDGATVFQRLDTAKAYLVYKIEGLSSFTLNAYKTNLVKNGTISFEVSPTGEDDSWTVITPVNTNPDGTTLKFYRDIYESPALLEGTNYLRITINGGDRAWVPQLSSMELRYPKDSEVPLSDISFDNTQAYVDIHKSATLVPTLTPMNASEAVVWSSSDLDIAEVSQTGELTPKSVGTSIITASNGDGSIEASIEVHILPKSIAIGKDTKASAFTEGYGPEKAVDDDSNTASRWAAPYNGVAESVRDAAWLQVDLGEMYALSDVHIEWEIAYGKEYKIQVSNTGEDGTWTDAAHITDGKANYSAIPLMENTRGRFVRFQGIKCGTGFAYTIIEFKVYGEVMGEVIVDKSVLQKLIDDNKDRIKEDYTESSWLVFETELMNANTVNEKADATQEEVDAAAEALEQAAADLETVPQTVDKSALQELIHLNSDKKKSDYTESSWLVFETELVNANAINEKADATQEEVDAAAEALEQAAANLETVPQTVDKSALQELIHLNSDKKKADYTESSWLVFETELMNANTINDKADATQDEVDTIVYALQEAIAALKPADKPIVKPVDINSLTLSAIPNCYYTGKELKPGITLKHGTKTLKAGMDYTLSYQNNKAVGEAVIIVTGTGGYSGTKKVVFRILPSDTRLGLKTRSTTTITLKWAKAAGADGYYIYRSTSKKGTYSKIAKITKASATSLKNSKLKSGKIYYYKIIPYTIINNKKIVKGKESVPFVTATKPEAPKLTLKSGKKQVTVSFKKITRAKGYELYRASSKKGKYQKVKSLSAKSTMKYTNKKLKSKKSYYFKVRTYIIVNGKKVYSNWSKVQGIKVK